MAFFRMIFSFFKCMYLILRTVTWKYVRFHI